jgi:hypothetical protein
MTADSGDSVGLDVDGRETLFGIHEYFEACKRESIGEEFLPNAKPLFDAQGGDYFMAYRLHLPDSIVFQKHFTLRIHHGQQTEQKKYQVLSLWYQE